MTVYVVTDGEYSDYHIEAVFTNKEQAEIYAAIYGYNVEEYETDEIKIDPQELYIRYEIKLSNELKVLSASSELSVHKDEKSVLPFNYGMSVCFTTKRDISKEQAIKIARDYAYQYLMEEIENKKAEISKLMEDAEDKYQVFIASNGKLTINK